MFVFEVRKRIFLPLLWFQSTTHHPCILLNLVFYCCTHNPFPSSRLFTSVSSSAPRGYAFFMYSMPTPFQFHRFKTFSPSFILRINNLRWTSPCACWLYFPHTYKSIEQQQQQHRHAVSTALLFSASGLYQPLAFICTVNDSRPHAHSQADVHLQHPGRGLSSGLKEVMARGSNVVLKVPIIPNHHYSSKLNKRRSNNVTNVWCKSHLRKLRCG